MDIKELRRGNLLQTIKKDINNTRIGNNIVIVKEINENDIEAEDATEIDKYGVTYHLDDCEPIKLSEYLLEECGFEKQTRDTGSGKSEFPQLETANIIYIYKKDHNGFPVEFVMINDNGEFKIVMENPTAMYGYDFSEQVLSLHQLQNMFFDITKTPMSIQL